MEAHGFQPKGGAYFFWGEEEWEVALQRARRRRRQRLAGGALRVRQAAARPRARAGRRGRTRASRSRSSTSTSDRPVAARWAGATNGTAAGSRSTTWWTPPAAAGVLATKHLKNRQFHEVFRNVAAWTYWKESRTLDRGPEGAIAVCSSPRRLVLGDPAARRHARASAWSPAGTASTRSGPSWAASRRSTTRRLGECPAVLDLLVDAEQVAGMKVEQDYSYTADERSAARATCSRGDAACFLDPLLSTGVHLATYSAMLGAAAIGSVLRGEADEDEALGVLPHRLPARLRAAAGARLGVLRELPRQGATTSTTPSGSASTAREELNLQDAFDRIVTGIADLDDAAGRRTPRVQAHLHRRGERRPQPAGQPQQGARAEAGADQPGATRSAGCTWSPSPSWGWPGPGSRRRGSDRRCHPVP